MDICIWLGVCKRIYVSGLEPDIGHMYLVGNLILDIYVSGLESDIGYMYQVKEPDIGYMYLVGSLIKDICIWL